MYQYFISFYGAIMAQLVKNLPAMRKTWIQSLAWEDPLEKKKATHSSILAWRIPWTVESMGLQRVGHDWATFTFQYYIVAFSQWLSHKVFTFNAGESGDMGSIPRLGRSPGEGNDNPLQYSCPGNSMDIGDCGLQSMGSQRVRHSWAHTLSILHCMEYTLFYSSIHQLIDIQVVSTFWYYG